MEELEFRVSAKTAKLIGRENISAVDGAIIELVKNAYDADAECVYIKYNMPFPNILKNTTYTYLEHYLSKEELKYVLQFYEPESERSDKVTRKNEIADKDITKLQSILFSKNEIIIIDNGTGMTKSIMKTTWMNIATSDKEKNMYSEKGRIKTGAKGIGRFALEKLSTATKVYTKNKDDKLLEWNINWNQFDELELLNDIKATLEDKDSTYEQTIQELIGKNEFSKLKKFNWNTGTALILTPTREEWTDRLFKKVNTNMQSINPLGSVDTFEIYINNTYDVNLNFISNNLEIQDYDYRIKAQYDGNNTIKVFLKRNEVDLNAEKAIIKINGKIYEFNLSEFWNREAFKLKNYYKEDYDKEIEIDLIVDKEIKDYELEKIEKVGPFTIDLYFMKGGNSDDSIIKKIKKKTRTEMLDKFSGIKLYRDNFKVRPYGEFEDGMYDWLNLGVRAQRSPAGIKHPSGNWRTLPYQTIGCVKIGRNENPKLIDMANREGLATNEEYYIFVEMIQKVLSVFEYDRQYVYREYGKWLDSKEDKIDKKEKILESIKNEKQKSNNEYNEDNDEYTKKEYRETVYKLNKEKDEEQKTKEILMSFGSAGIITNTFSHELRGIENEMGNRMQYIRHTVKKLLNDNDYEGDEDLNPFKFIDEAEKTDKLLNSWISVVIDGVQKNSFEKEEINVSKFVENIINEWTPLMEKKHIFFNKPEIEDIKINIEKVDLYAIFNNFFLNSAWFLEKLQGKRREINIKILKKDTIEIYLENNGPILDNRYKDNPDRVFNAGETSKGDKGTGLGLWIMREVINKNDGEIHIMQKEDGFGIKINIPI